jgi:hypothetical protein
MWKPTFIPTTIIHNIEANVESDSDTECRKANHDHIADNHTGRDVLRIVGGSHLVDCRYRMPKLL